MSTQTTTHPEQLPLLDEPARVPPRFRLDERTRRVGLAGVARARAILAEQARRRAEAELADQTPFVRRAA
jgi:hypothetical protein